MPKKKKSRDVDKMKGQKNNNYEVIDSTNAARSGKESYGEEPPFYACDRKRCLNGRCGVCWLVILGVAIAAGICAALVFGGALGFSFSTDGNETLYELICDSCTFEPTSDPTSTPTTDPTSTPTVDPTGTPSVEPTGVPSVEPTYAPTGDPTLDPSGVPSVEPTIDPTGTPTVEPTIAPTSPTYEPTKTPTADPTVEPTSDPTVPTNEPTADPTSPTNEPTADPTSERRLYKSETTPNVLLIVADGIGNTEIETPKVNEFLKEGYTFKNINEKFSWSSLITGKSVAKPANEQLRKSRFDINTPTFVEHLRSKGYKNYYYGNWLKYGAGAWDSNRAINKSEDLVLEEVQSDIGTLRDEMWSITVALTKSDAHSGFAHHSNKTAVYDICMRYFKAGSPDYDYDSGVSCQRSMTCDEKFGKVLEALKTTGLWEHTMVVLVAAGQQKKMFSIGGGLLPTKFMSRVNEDVHSFLSVVPTILAFTGFSESELANLKLERLPVISENHAYAMAF